MELDEVKFEEYARGYKDGFQKAIERIEHELKHMNGMVHRLRYGLCDHDYQLTSSETAVCNKCGAKTSAR